MAVYKFVIVLAIACALSESTNADENCKDFPSGDAKNCCAIPLKKLVTHAACLEEKKKENACPTDCFFDAAKVFANDDIDREAIVSVVAGLFDGEDPAWSPVFEKSIDTCIAIIKEHKQDDTKPKEHHGPHGGKCNFKAMMMMHCVNREIFLNCPANFWTSNEECEAWKVFTTKCPHAHRMHGHHKEAAE